MGDLERMISLGKSYIEGDDKSLAHYGVKGMKWGVRKQRSLFKGDTGYISARSTLSRRDRKEQDFIYNPDGIYDKVYKRASAQIRKGTRIINKKYKGEDFRKSSPKRDEYYKEYSKMVEDQLNAASTAKAHIFTTRRLGMSPHRTMQMKFSFDYEKELRASYDISKADVKNIVKSARSKAKKSVSSGGAVQQTISSIKDKFSHSDMDVENGIIDVIIEAQIDDMGFIKEDEDISSPF